MQHLLGLDNFNSPCTSHSKLTASFECGIQQPRFSAECSNYTQHLHPLIPERKINSKLHSQSCVFNPLKSRMVRDTHICKLTLINSVIIKLNMMMMMMTSMIKFAMCYICLHDADTTMTIQNTQKVEGRRLCALMGHTKHRLK